MKSNDTSLSQGRAYWQIVTSSLKGNDMSLSQGRAYGQIFTSSLNSQPQASKHPSSQPRASKFSASSHPSSQPRASRFSASSIQVLSLEHPSIQALSLPQGQHQEQVFVCLKDKSLSASRTSLCLPQGQHQEQVLGRVENVVWDSFSFNFPPPQVV